MGSEEFKLSEKNRFVKIRPSVFQALILRVLGRVYTFSMPLYTCLSNMSLIECYSSEK
jgi:hypothetical protein